MATIFENTGSRHITSGMLNELEEQLSDSLVLTPDSQEYPAAMKRWSNAAEKEAVLYFFSFLHDGIVIEEVPPSNCMFRSSLSFPERRKTFQRRFISSKNMGLTLQL